MLKKYNILRISKEIFHLARNTNNSKEDIEDIIVNYRYSLNNQPSRLPAIKNFKFIVNTLKVTDCAKLYKWHNILHAKPENLLTIVNDAKITDLYELATLRRLMGDNVSNKKLKIIINEQGVSDFEQLKRLALYFSLAHSRQDEKVERTINDGKYDPARQYTLREYAKDLKIQTFIGEESMNDFYQLKRLLYAE